MLRIGVIILLAGLLGMTSCKKEGCTDSAASNYSEEAKDDDGSCTYSTTVVVWWDKSTSEFNTSWGAKTANVYLNNELIKSLPSSKFWNAAPACSDADAVTKSYDLGTSKNKSLELKIDHLDSTGTVIVTGSSTENVSYGTCIPIEGI